MKVMLPPFSCRTQMFILPELKIYLQPTSFFCNLPLCLLYTWMMVVQAIGCAWWRDVNEGCEGTVVMSNGIDYAAEAELFDYATEAALFSRSGWSKSRRPPLGYKRFARASDAIRFAIEELPQQLLVSTILEVADKRYRSREIRFLYESEDYPLSRRL